MKSLDYYTEPTKRPGKFEGESPLTVFIYEESMDGGLDIVSDDDDSFHAQEILLSGWEMEVFGVAESKWVLIEDSQGFVFSIPACKFASWKGEE
jgi:hypothetical protein